MSGVDGLLSGRWSGEGESSVLRNPTLHLVQTKNEWEISHSRWGDFPPKAIHFCMPEFPEIGKRYTSLAYFVSFLNSPLQKIIK